MADQPPLDRAPLPVPRTRLIGRDTERAMVQALLLDEAVPLLTLTGPGGVGKTRLALQVASDVADTFADGVAFVSLAPIRDPDFVVPAIARTLGLRDMGGRPLTDRLIGFLRQRDTLLVLDNFEQLLSAAPLLVDLLTACPRLKLLVTSRAKLRLSGEHEFPVLPLTLPALNGRPLLAEVASAAATMLFVARAQAVNPAFVLTDENATIVAAICARLDGLPLALELAAARIDHLPLTTMLARLEPSLLLLTGGARDLPDRLRTMRDAIAWSYDLLAPEEQALFRRLAVFRGGFSLAAIESLSFETDDRPSDMLDAQSSMLDLVSSLVDKSLLRREEREDEPRYRMLETVREYGQAKLRDSGEFDSARQAHATHFLALAERAAPEWWGSDPGAWLDRLEADHDNVRAALAWAIDRHNTNVGCRLAIAMHWLWRIRGPVSEGRRWMEDILAGSEMAPAGPRAALMTRLGDLAMVQGDLERAADLQEASIALAREAGDGLALTWALGYRGLTALHNGELDLAEDRLHQALSRARTEGPPAWVPAALGALASVARRQGDHAREAAMVEEAIAICQAGGNAWYTASILSQLGDAAVDRNDFGRADALYRDALGRLTALGDRRHAAGSLAGFAWTAAALGDARRAVRLCGAVDALLELTGLNLSPDGQIRYESALSAARAGLEASGFETARAAGRMLSLDQVQAEVNRSSAAAISRPSRLTTPFGLTDRELMVVRLLPSATYREIASQLFISERTVEHHVRNVCAKLGVHHRREAAEIAKKYGLLSPEQPSLR